MGLALSWAHPEPSGPLAGVKPAGEEGQAGGGEAGTTGEGPGLSAFPQHWHRAHTSPAPPGCPAQPLAQSAPTLQVTECLQELGRQLRALEEAWALRRRRCQGSWDLQRLQQGLEQAEAWLASWEGLLLDPSCGVSQSPAPLPATPASSSGQGQLPLVLLPLATQAGCRARGEGSRTPGGRASHWLASPQHSVSDVELLLRRHQDLEKLLAAQEEKFVQLQRKAGVSKAGSRDPQHMGPERWWWEQFQSQPETVRVSPGHGTYLRPFRETPFFPLPASVCRHPHSLVGCVATVDWGKREVSWAAGKRALSGWEGWGKERLGTHTLPGPRCPDLVHLAPLPQMELNLLQQVRGLKRKS